MLLDFFQCGSSAEPRLVKAAIPFFNDMVTVVFG